MQLGPKSCVLARMYSRCSESNVWLNSLPPGKIVHAFCRLLIFFKIIFSKIFVVFVFVFNVKPTAKVIWRWAHSLKSHPTDWWSWESNLQPLVYMASGLSTTPQWLLLFGKILSGIPSVSNSLAPDQSWHFVEPGLGSNCLQRLSADYTVKWVLRDIRV